MILFKTTHLHFVYYLNQDIKNIIRLLVVFTVALFSTGTVFLFIALEADTLRMRMIACAVALGPSIDLLRNQYPRSGCATYMVALLFFVTSRDVREHTSYVVSGVGIILISTLAFMIGRQSTSP